MSKAHIDGFLADIRRANPGFTESRSSLIGLLQYLRNTSNNPVPLTLLSAKQQCTNVSDPRLNKYGDAIRNLVAVWSTGKPYPGHEINIGRLMFRGDSRAPTVIFNSGFAPHQPGQIQYRDVQQDIDPETAVAISPSPYVAANFPLPEAWGPNAFLMATNSPCWVYALYVEHGFNTVGQQAINAIAGAPGASALVYAGEMATSGIPANRILAAVQVTRNFVWVAGIPKPADWLSRGTFQFQPATFAQNNAYSGPEHATYLNLVNNLLTDGTNRAFPH